MLEHYNVRKLTEGIDLEWSKLRDRVQKWFSHLEVLDIENEAKEVREGGSLGGGGPWGAALLALEPFVIGGLEFGEGGASHWRLKIGEGNDSKFKYPGPMPGPDIVRADRTLSGLDSLSRTGHLTRIFFKKSKF
jgi:hypothetical protein